MNFFWHVIIFLLLCDNENISPWHNILNNVQNKNLVLAKNNFASKQKVWCCTKNNFMSTEKKLILQKKMYLMSTKARWCCTKKIFSTLKTYKFFSKRRAICSYLSILNFTVLLNYDSSLHVKMKSTVSHCVAKYSR